MGQEHGRRSRGPRVAVVVSWTGCVGADRDHVVVAVHGLDDRADIGLERSQLACVVADRDAFLKPVRNSDGSVFGHVVSPLDVDETSSTPRV